MNSTDMEDAGRAHGTDVVESVRARLGPVGVWSELIRSAPVSEQRQAVARIEALGYGSLWWGEGIGGKDAFVNAAVVLSSSTTLMAGTGIANLWARHPANMQGAGASVGAAWPRRFVLGVGVSHGSQVVPSGQVYERPLQRMASYLEDMNAAAAIAPDTNVPVPRVIAALGPKMTALARDHADGAHPYFVPPEHIPRAREVLGPDKLLIPEFAVVLSGDTSEARRAAREHMAWYLTQPNYATNLLRLGYDDNDVAGGGSDRLVDALVAWGDEGMIARRVQEMIDCGADHVLLQPLAADANRALNLLEALAPAVLQRP